MEKKNSSNDIENLKLGKENENSDESGEKKVQPGCSHYKRKAKFVVGLMHMKDLVLEVLEQNMSHNFIPL